MLSYVGRSCQLAPTLKGATQVVATGLKNGTPGVIQVSAGIAEKSPLMLTSTAMAKRCPTGQVIAKSGIPVTTQVRYAHSDVQVPDFTAYRRSDVQDPRVKSGDSAASRSAFTYMIIGGGTVSGMYAAKTVVHEFVSSMSASADVLAMAQIEIKMDDIPEGKSVTFKWRGKPLFIRHRTDKEIDTEGSVDVATLRDPESDAERCNDPKWLVVLGVCTHLGCVPIADAGDYGGYYCPCHGSHYDTAGRIRKGPAPLNLEIPAYEFPEPGLLVVG